MQGTVASRVNSGIPALSKQESRASAARHRTAVSLTCGSVRALGARLATTKQVIHSLAPGIA